MADGAAGRAGSAAAPPRLPGVELYDWLLVAHVLSAFVLAAGITVLWVAVLATRAGATSAGPEEGARLGGLAGPLAGVGAVGTIVFGIWLAIEVEGYDLLDGWIVGSIVLWAIGSYTGERSGRELAAGPEGRDRGVRLHVIATAAMVLVLVLMIWKPGA